MTNFSAIQNILTTEELSLLRKLNSPEKIQDFVSSLPHNFEENGDSCMSVREVLKTQQAHCIESALVSALALWMHGEKPLIMDMSANDRDDDHVITLFQKNGLWGAISKSNHAYLRYRDPVYRTLRELSMSYFHEYYNTQGEKTLRSYSRPLLLKNIPHSDWISGEHSWRIAEMLCDIRHYDLIPKISLSHLRPIADVQMRIMPITEHKHLHTNPRKRRA